MMSFFPINVIFLSEKRLQSFPKVFVIYSTFCVDIAEITLFSLQNYLTNLLVFDLCLKYLFLKLDFFMTSLPKSLFHERSLITSDIPFSTGACQ